MTSAAPSRAPEARPRKPAPVTAAERRRARLALVDPEVLAGRTRRHQARILLGLSACVLTAAILIVAAANSLVVSQQVRLDSVRSQVAVALAQDQNLQLERAVLESPARILAIAEHVLGMVAPSSVTYLMPVAPAGGSIGGRHVASGSVAGTAGGASPRR